MLYRNVLRQIAEKGGQLRDELLQWGCFELFVRLFERLICQKQPDISGNPADFLSVCIHSY